MRAIKYVLFGLFCMSVVLNVILYKQWKLTDKRSLRFEELCEKVQKQNQELKIEFM